MDSNTPPAENGVSASPVQLMIQIRDSHPNPLVVELITHGIIPHHDE